MLLRNHVLLSVAWAALTAVCRASLSLAPENLDALFPLEDDRNYVVNIHAPLATAIHSDGSLSSSFDGKRELAALTDPASTYTYEITDADGDSYTCYLPSDGGASTAVAADAAQTQPRPTARQRLIDEKLAKVRSKLSPSSAIATAAKGQALGCLAKQAGYWTYLVCPGRQVRQYHADPSNGGSADKTALSFNLGEFVEAGGDELRVTPTGMLYVQNFSSGTDGRRTSVTYVCDPHLNAKLPTGITSDIVAIDETTPLNYAIVWATRDAVLCGAIPSTAALIAPLNTTVVRHVDGWWTYEIAIGGVIRQYHDAGSGQRHAESVIGVYDWAFGEQVEGASLGHQPAIVQKYYGGSPCSVKGNQPRRATIRFECSPPGAVESVSPSTGGVSAGATLGLSSIKEPETCTYEITLTTSVTCGHPDVMPARSRAVAVQPPAQAITCFADADEEERLVTEALQRVASSSTGGSAAAAAATGG